LRLAAVRTAQDTCGMDPASAPVVTRAPRLWTVDALRGFCAVIVFLSHWHLWSNFDPATNAEHMARNLGAAIYAAGHVLTWPTGGHHPAVICFFVLSGFCIHFPFEYRAKTSFIPNWENYFRRRFWRIMPVYWTASLIGLAFVAAEKLYPSGSALLAFHAQTSLPHVGVRFAGLAAVYPQEIFVGNYILNTVAVEMLMYLVYPLFFRYAARGAWAILGWAFVAMHVFAIFLLQFVTPYWVFNSIFMLGIFWFFGAYAAHVLVVQRRRISLIWPMLSWLMFLALKSVPHFYGLNLLIQLTWALVCALGVLWIAGWETHQPKPRFGRMRGTLSFASQVSYSLYAVHTPAVMLATWALLVFARSENYSAQLGATLAASVIATLVVYYGVERVFYRPQN